MIYNLYAAEGEGVVVCPFRRLTTLPCPGCGLTTSLVALLRGDFGAAVATHPLSILALVFLLLGPVVLLIAPNRCYESWSKIDSILSGKKGLLMIGLVIGSVWIYLIVRSLHGRF